MDSIIKRRWLNTFYELKRIEKNRQNEPNNRIQWNNIVTTPFIKVVNKNNH